MGALVCVCVCGVCLCVCGVCVVCVCGVCGVCVWSVCVVCVWCVCGVCVVCVCGVCGVWCVCVWCVCGVCVQVVSAVLFIRSSCLLSPRQENGYNSVQNISCCEKRVRYAASGCEDVALRGFVQHKPLDMGSTAAVQGRGTVSE